jgi:predicted RNA polymerase sigma factor
VSRAEAKLAIEAVWRIESPRLIAGLARRGKRFEDRRAALYDALAQLTPSPVVELNRAVAISMAGGPQEALGLVDGLAAGGELDGYHLLRSVRADLLEKLGRTEEAREEFERAAAMTENARERELLLRRAARLAGGSSGPRI